MAIRMDYEKIYSCIKETGTTARNISLLCGKSEGWLSMAKKADSSMADPLAKLLARNLGVELDDIVWKEDTPTVVSYDDLMKAVLVLTEKVEQLVEVVGIQQDDILSILAGTNKIASAVAIANAMLQASGRCKESRYREACSRRNINAEEMKRALEDVGAHYETVGKGAQATRWIVKERLGA